MKVKSVDGVSSPENTDGIVRVRRPYASSIRIKGKLIRRRHAYGPTACLSGVIIGAAMSIGTGMVANKLSRERIRKCCKKDSKTLKLCGKPLLPVEWSGPDGHTIMGRMCEAGHKATFA